MKQSELFERENRSLKETLEKTFDKASLEPGNIEVLGKFDLVEYCSERNCPCVCYL